MTVIQVLFVMLVMLYDVAIVRLILPSTQQEYAHQRNFLADSERHAPEDRHWQYEDPVIRE